MDYGSLINFLGSRKSPLQNFNTEIHAGEEDVYKRALAENQKAQEARLSQMAPYEMQLKQAQALNAQNNMNNMPLRTDLLKAQIEYQKQRAANAKANAGAQAGLTKANLTKNQGIIQAIENVTPLIEQLSDKKYDVPNQLYGPYLHPDQQRNYVARTAAITDSLIASMGLPKTNESIHLASTMVNRGKNESLSAYRERLTELKKDLASRKKRAHQAIKSGFSNNETSGDDAVTADFNYDENGNQIGQ